MRVKIGPRAGQGHKKPREHYVPRCGVIEVEFQDRDTYLAAWLFLRRRTKVYLGEFMQWIKQK